MTREQIEQAAIKFAKSHYLDKYGNMNAEITKDEFDALVCSIAYMFMYGAQWRINSVWHDVREQPEQDKYFIYEIGDGRYETDCIYKKEKLNWERYAAQLNIIRWAYVDDLLPERKKKAE